MKLAPTTAYPVDGTPLQTTFCLWKASGSNCCLRYVTGEEFLRMCVCTCVRAHSGRQGASCSGECGLQSPLVMSMHNEARNAHEHTVNLNPLFSGKCSCQGFSSRSLVLAGPLSRLPPAPQCRQPDTLTMGLPMETGVRVLGLS